MSLSSLYKPGSRFHLNNETLVYTARWALVASFITPRGEYCPITATLGVSTGVSTMLTALPLYLLLQTLQYCSAGSVDCGKLVERLNRSDGKAVKEIDENWNDCGLAFLEKASPVGIEVLFKTLETDPLASKDQVVQDMADMGEFARKINTKQLRILFNSGAAISSRFFANVPDIKSFHWPPSSKLKLPENILEYYDGPMNNTFWMTPEQFKLFGGKLDKEFLCRSLDYIPNRGSLFGSISLKCFRGLLRSKALVFSSGYAICPETVEEWTNHLEEDLEHVDPGEYWLLPVSVWQKILELPTLVDRVPRNYYKLEDSNMLRVSLFEIGHVSFAAIARQRPYWVETLLDLPLSKLPEDIFASCGKDEMGSFETKLGIRARNIWRNPEIIGNISSALDDDQHYCNGMDSLAYHARPWLRRYGSAKCRSLITRPREDDRIEFPELSNVMVIWDLHIERIKNNEFQDVNNTIPLLTTRKEFCKRMAKTVTSEDLKRLDDRVLQAIGGKCALALKPLITKDVAVKLGPLAFWSFKAKHFNLNLADITPLQVSHLSKGVPTKSSAFTKIEITDLLNCDEETFGILTDSQIDAIHGTQDYIDWIEFRRQVARLIRKPLPGGLKEAFLKCLDFRDKGTHGLEGDECLYVLARIIPKLSDRYWASSMGDLFDDANLQPLRTESPIRNALLKKASRLSFDMKRNFVVNHDGQKYDLEQSLTMIRDSYMSLGNPESTLRHRATLGDGPLRAWLGELLSAMKDTMISNMSNADASIQKFRFPIKGSDGLDAGFLVGKAMQQGLKLPFALDPKFYELVLHASENEIEDYFKGAYFYELKTFHDINLYQRVMGDSFELTSEQETQVKQVLEDQTKTPEEKTEAIEKVRNKAWFDRNRDDCCWAPLNSLTFNGFASTSNYKTYDIPRDKLSIDDWIAKNSSVYSEFEYENMSKFFKQFRDKCLQEFRTFVKCFRSRLGRFLIMPESPIRNKQLFSDLLALTINSSPMTAEELLSKINVEAGVDIDSWYGTVKSEVVFKTFVECLTPKQLSKLVAVWTGAASTDLDLKTPMVSFHDPEDAHEKYNSRKVMKRSTEISNTVVIHEGDEYRSFLKEFSAKLRDAMNS
ncbi:hypothetical protein PSACC_02888, partial [Paramicrosporidium saccamoebae]